MDKGIKTLIASHRGLVGSAFIRNPQVQRYVNLLTRTRAELDQTHQTAAEAFFAREKPDHVLLAAAKVGGIRTPTTGIRSSLFATTSPFRPS